MNNFQLIFSSFPLNKYASIFIILLHLFLFILFSSESLSFIFLFVIGNYAFAYIENLDT